MPYTLKLESSSSEDEEEEDIKNEDNQIPTEEKVDSQSDDGLVPTQKDELNASFDEQPTTETRRKKRPRKKRQQKVQPPRLEETIPVKAIDSKFVYVERSKEVNATRRKLPIITEEYQIVEEIKNNPVVIICGETGSGKTTQIPQFLYEHGFAVVKQIVVTQPRRVAAISMSKRVAHEMSLSTDVVSYQIRYEGNTTENTKIKFVTDGVLMKEMQKDFLLSKYSVVIIDEAHERSIYSDILIGLISRIIKLREKRGDSLRLIIMSATLRVSDFTENRKLFRDAPPVVKIESRQFPVSVHFSKHTPQNYIKEAFKKICKIHKDYPEGGILVFLTGRKEVNLLISQLHRAFPHTAVQGPTHTSKPATLLKASETKPKIGKNSQGEDSDDDAQEEFFKRQKSKTQNVLRKKKNVIKAENPSAFKEKTLKDLIPNIDLDSVSKSDTLGDAQLLDSDSEGSIQENDFEGSDADKLLFNDPLYCLPLYSMLPEREQAKVFEPAPHGTRLCVVATNVAETSLTIPGIKYVIDAGKVKNKFYDKYTGISAHLIEWCAKSSADQRAGRSGRTAPGHCFRLYSSAVYNNDFKEFPEAEILKKPLDDLILQLKSMHIEVVRNFPFPTAPDLTNIEATEKRLVLLGALENRLNVSKSNNKKFKTENPNVYTSVISSLGKLITNFPVSPRYGKILAIALQQGLIDHIITIVACLTVQEVFLHHSPDSNDRNPGDEEGDVKEKSADEKELESALDKKWKEINCTRKKWMGTGNSMYLGDVMLMLKAVHVCETKQNSAFFCETMGIRHKSIIEIRKLRLQLVREVVNSFPSYQVTTDLSQVQMPANEQLKKLRQLMLLGFCDRVARIMPPSEATSSSEERKSLRGAYQSIELEQPVFINDKSPLKEHRPEWVVYQEIYENKKLYMRTVVAIEEEWIPIYAQNLCKFSKPMEKPEPRYDPVGDRIKCHVVPTFGPFSWILNKAEIEFPECNEKFKLFARSLLEGKVYKSLAKYAKDYISSPIILTKEWGRLHEITGQMLGPLVSKKITSKAALQKEFQQRPSCEYRCSDFLSIQFPQTNIQTFVSVLLKEFQAWLPKSIHYEVSQNWPPTN